MEKSIGFGTMLAVAGALSLGLAPAGQAAQQESSGGAGDAVPYSQKAAEEPDPGEGKLQMSEEFQTRGGADLASFEALDSDGDGVISRSEAMDSGVLDTRFSEADEDSDGEINRAEFSAFEQQELQTGTEGAGGGAQRQESVPPEDAGQQEQ